MSHRLLVTGPDYSHLESEAFEKLKDNVGTQSESVLYLTPKDHPMDATRDRWREFEPSAALRIDPVSVPNFCDSMETLLLHESVKQDMGRKRPFSTSCHRARLCDWSMCERSRVMGVTARLPPDAAVGKARIGESLLHALASRVNKQ
jgi:hypothetical protein